AWLHCVRAQHAMVGDGTERKDDFQFAERSDARRQEGAAELDLFWGWLVFRRRTADSVGDHGADKRETVIRIGAILALRKTEFLERAIKQFAGVIAGKRTPGAIGAHASRRQSHDQQTSIGIAERWGRAIEPVRMRARVLGAVADEPRAKRAMLRRFRRR